MKTKKFKGFSPVDKQTWIDQAVEDIKGEDFEDRLVTKALEGFPLFPFYTAEDSNATRWVKAYENQVNPISQTPEIPPRVWANAVEVKGGDDQMLNREILFVLENGADGLIVELSGKEDLEKVFKEVIPEFIQIWIKPIGEPRTCLKAFYSWVADQSIHSSHINGGLLWDGLVQGFDHRINLEEQLEATLFLHELSKPYPNFKSICLDTSVYHNAGATAVQDVGYGMAAFVELMDGLTEKGAKAEDIFQDIFICTAVGSHYFMEMAKLRTIRIGFHQLANLYQVALNPEDILLFSKCSRWSKSRMEPYNNLLRNTTEAMSAILGGCNTLFIEPHDTCYQDPDDFSKRMARNISIILKEECYFDKLLDPAAGSYYWESLIHSLQEHAVQLLKKVEDKGGWWKLYLENNIQEDIKRIRQEKFDHVLNAAASVKGIDPKVDSARNRALKNKDYTEEAYQLKSFSQCFHYESTL